MKIKKYLLQRIPYLSYPRHVIIAMQFGLFLFFLKNGHTQTILKTQEHIQPTVYKLGRKEILIKKTSYQTEGLNFLVIHDDENTGLEAAKTFCEQYGGSITELSYGEVRNIVFKQGTSNYAFDPNGMFTEKGMKISLKRYSKSKVNAQAMEICMDLGRSLLDVYRKNNLGYIITLHNNTEGFFDINSYQQGNAFAKCADSIHINPSMDPDDLLFVTDANYYQYLKKRDINVVLQSVNAPNDGTLSFYAQANSIPYVNIEVQHGHPEVNKKLIELVSEMFRNMLTDNLKLPPLVSANETRKS